MHGFIKRSAARAKEDLSSWFPAIFVFEACLTIVISRVLGLWLNMPWYEQVVIGGLIFVAIATAIKLYHAGDEARLKRVAERIKGLAVGIETGALTIQPARVAGPKRDVLDEVGAQLRGMLKPSIADSLHSSIVYSAQADPKVIAKLFLESLLDSLSPCDLRDH
jgi:hypothetical protein